MMTDGFNSCRNVVCNFTEGNFCICGTPQRFSSQLWYESRGNFFQVPCIHSLKYAYLQKQQRLLRGQEKFLMFSTVSGFWKPLAFLLSLVLDLDRKKGNYSLNIFFSNIPYEKYSLLQNLKDSFQGYLPVGSLLPSHCNIFAILVSHITQCNSLLRVKFSIQGLPFKDNNFTG